MLIIRLQRVGKKNQPSFRIVLAEKHRAAQKKVIEILGYYNPRTKDFGIKSEERLKYWLGQHVEVSPTVHNLLVAKGLLSEKKVRAWRPKKKKAKAAPETKEEGKEVAATPEVKEEKNEEKVETESAPA